MSGIDKLKERITKEAEEASAKILTDAQKEANDILNKSKQKAEAKKAAIIENAQKTAAENAERIISTAQMQIRNQKLEVKQDLIETVFNKAKENIKSLDNVKYLDMLFDMILNSVISGDEELVVTSNDRLKINNEFMVKLNKTLKEAGKKGQLVLSQETREIQGGFILKSKGVEINSSIEAVVRSLRDEMEQDIASILFA